MLVWGLIMLYERHVDGPAARNASRRQIRHANISGGFGQSARRRSASAGAAAWMLRICQVEMRVSGFVDDGLRDTPGLTVIGRRRGKNTLSMHQFPVPAIRLCMSSAIEKPSPSTLCRPAAWRLNGSGGA